MHNYIHLRDSVYSTMKFIVVGPAAVPTVGTMRAFGLILPNQKPCLRKKKKKKKERKTISMPDRTV